MPRYLKFLTFGTGALLIEKVGGLDEGQPLEKAHMTAHLDLVGEFAMCMCHLEDQRDKYWQARSA